MGFWKYMLLVLLAGFLLWVVADLSSQRKVNLRKFDPIQVAHLDADMWRSYYEKKPLLLFWQLAQLTRQQAHASFWRSFLLAFYASRAAFVFKEGKSRADYIRALPALEKYYQQLNELSDTPFDVSEAAGSELEWWIIRREREVHPPQEWTRLQARVASQLYGLPASRFIEYARLRTEAMVYRDRKGDAMQAADWAAVRSTLEKSWKALHASLAR